MFPSMQKSLIKVKNIFFNYEKKIMFTNSVWKSIEMLKILQQQRGAGH
jgi:hypothetical protein